MKVIVSKTCANVSDAEMLTSGMVGKTVDVEFSADWIGLTKIAVFTNGETTRDVLDPNGAVIIPWEVLATPNRRAQVGFYGYRMENGEKVLAIPTIWAELGAVRAGADPSGDPSAELSPTVAEQLQADVTDLDDRVTYIEEHGGGFDIHSLTAENELADGDEMPFYDVSKNAPRKTTWSNLKAKLKAYFDTLYNKVTKTSELENDSGFLTEHQSLAAYRTAAAQDVIDNGKASAASVTAIEAKIPSAATSANQLADKAFVNSTVGTNTAYYISNNGQPFTSLAQLEAYSGTVTNNDYAFVVGTDSAGNTTYTRYKYNASTEAWAAEYVLNNSSFTAVQWAAIQSGITSGDVALIRTALQPSDLPAPEVFTAIYGTTTYNEILAAYNAGKKVICKRRGVNTYFYELAYVYSDAIRFGSVTNSCIYSANITSSDTWSNSSVIYTDYALKTDLDDYVAKAQGVAHAGEFLVVGADGNVTTMTLATWQGGSY